MKLEVDWDFNPEKGAKTGDALHDMLDELQSLIELHERNSLNLALTGGLESLTKYLFKHPDD
jgi:superfamily I DNA/RNA helicase